MPNTQFQGLALHDVKNIHVFVGICLTDAIKKNQSRLRDEQIEDAHSYLMEVIIREHHKWDRDKIPDFSHWVREVVKRRYIDWLRKELGDSRYKTKRPTFISYEQHTTFAAEREDTTFGSEELSVPDFADASDSTVSIQEAFAELSDKGKWILANVAQPYSEGHTPTEIGATHEKSSRWVREQLALLREELETQGVEIWA